MKNVINWNGMAYVENSLASKFIKDNHDATEQNNFPCHYAHLVFLQFGTKYYFEYENAIRAFYIKAIKFIKTPHEAKLGIKYLIKWRSNDGVVESWFELPLDKVYESLNAQLENKPINGKRNYVYPMLSQTDEIKKYFSVSYKLGGVFSIEPLLSICRWSWDGCKASKVYFNDIIKQCNEMVIYEEKPATFDGKTILELVAPYLKDTWKTKEECERNNTRRIYDFDDEYSSKVDLGITIDSQLRKMMIHLGISDEDYIKTILLSK